METLDRIGISSICTLIATVKTARYLELDGRDIVATVFTDAMELYASRLEELAHERGADRIDRSIEAFNTLAGGPP